MPELTLERGAAVDREYLAALDREAGAWDDNGIAQRIASEALPAVRLKRIMEGDPPAPPSMAVEELFLAYEINLVVGHGDSGKTTTLFHASACTTIRRPVFGSLAVKQSGRVALLVPEDGEEVARHHLDAIAAGLDLTPGERAELVDRLLIIGNERPYNLLRDTRALGAALRGEDVTLLIAEPIPTLLGGADENDPAVAAAVCDRLRRDICQHPDGRCTVVLAAHLRKPGREATDAAATVHDARGSGGWTNHARQVWSVSKPKGGSTITYRLVKSNRLRTGTTHEITLAIEADPANPAHWLSCRLTDANLGASSLTFTAGLGRTINENERRALAALHHPHEPGTRVSWSQWKETSGVKADTLKSIKDRLLDARLADRHVAGVRANTQKNYNYSITEAGIRALQTGWADQGRSGVGSENRGEWGDRGEGGVMAGVSGVTTPHLPPKGGGVVSLAPPVQSGSENGTAPPDRVSEWPPEEDGFADALAESDERLGIRYEDEP